MIWNRMERWRGVDHWPEATAEVTDIDQPFVRSDEFSPDYLSVITFSFKDQTGDYFSSKFQMRTCDLPDDLMTGSTVMIRYNPKNPNKTWFEDDYCRRGFGRWQSFGFPILCWSIFLLGILSIGLIMVFKLHK